MKNSLGNKYASGFSKVWDYSGVYYNSGATGIWRSDELFDVISTGGLPSKLPKYQRFRKLSYVNSPTVVYNTGWQFTKPNGQYTFLYQLTGSKVAQRSLVLSPPWSRLQDRCMEKIYDQIRGNSNLAVDFAERAQTIKLLRNSLSLKKLIKSFTTKVVKTRKYKRLKRSGNAARTAEYVSGKWLEYRYGWSPLIHSIFDAADTMFQRRHGGLRLFKARSGYRNRQLFSSGDVSVNGLLLESVDVSARVEYGLLFELDPGTKLQDWTSLNPLGIAWELVPFSFVADWFVNVSDQLALWENLVLFSSNFRGGYMTQTAKEERNATFWYQNVKAVRYWPNGQVVDDTYTRQSWGSSQSNFKFKERTVVTSLPRPAGFSFKVDLNSKRITDVAALITVLVKPFR